MKKIYLVLLVSVFTLSSGISFSQCTEPTEPKVLLVGDSWAWFMNTESTINNVLKTWGHSNYKFISNATLSVNGAQTDDVMKASTEAEILRQLTNNPSIEVVDLSIGGNDFLGDWKVSMTQAQTDTLKNQVFARLDSIVRFIKSCKPGIHILWSGYVYTNFQEIISGPGGLGSTHPFYGTWEGMEFPTALQLNTLQNSQSAQMVAYTNSDPQVHYVEANGLMQYLYGQTTPLGVPPGGTYAPLTVPMPLGDPSYPSPKNTMRDYFGFTKDCYHLSAQAYRDMVAYQTQKFFHKFLMDDLYLLSDNNGQRTGSVSSLGNTSDTLFLGEAGGEQFASVLSFNTTSMADTILRKASLFLRRKSLTGINPISSNLELKIKNGNFGTTVNVEAADFAATGDATVTPCLYGSNTANGDWIRFDLPASVLAHITNAATTQFVISAPAASGGVVQFYNSADPDFAPVLNLDYENPSAIPQINNNIEFNIYPNPTNGLLTIESGQEIITDLKVSNLLGEIILQPKVQNEIDISSLPSGVYVLNITTKSGTSSQRIIKN